MEYISNNRYNMTKINYVGSAVQGASVEQASYGLCLIMTNAEDILNALVSQGYECKNLLNFMLRKEDMLIVEKTIDKYVFKSNRAGKDIDVGITITLTVNEYCMGTAVTTLRYKDFECVSEMFLSNDWVTQTASEVKRMRESVERGEEGAKPYDFDVAFLSEVLTDFDKDYAITLVNLLK